jgi:ribosomal protein S18 acetylase RimI-like enzyme
MNKLTHRKATLHDLPTILALLLDDALGEKREANDEKINQRYIDAFHRIDADPNQYLMAVTLNNDLIGTCHLTLIPSLTFIGSTRLQIEAVRVSEKHRGQKIGEWMIQAAIQFARSNDATIIQLTTNKQRGRAIEFYERLGFEATHEGMKYYINVRPESQ